MVVVLAAAGLIACGCATKRPVARTVTKGAAKGAKTVVKAHVEGAKIVTKATTGAVGAVRKRRRNADQE